MSNHTPGPWVVAEGRGRVVHVNDACGNKLCTIAKWTEAIDRADASLIAAAPDMLAALRLVVHRPEGWPNVAPGELVELASGKDQKGGQRRHRQSRGPHD